MALDSAEDRNFLSHSPEPMQAPPRF
jgi:hypothetical protein